MADLAYANDEPAGIVSGAGRGFLRGGLKGALLIGGAVAVVSGLAVASIFGPATLLTAGAAWGIGIPAFMGAILGGTVGSAGGSVLGAFNGHAASQSFERQSAVRDRVLAAALSSPQPAPTQPVQYASEPQIQATPQTPSPALPARTTESASLELDGQSGQALQRIGVGSGQASHVETLLASGHKAPGESKASDIIAARETAEPQVAVR